MWSKITNRMSMLRHNPSWLTLSQSSTSSKSLSQTSSSNPYRTRGKSIVTSNLWFNHTTKTKSFRSSYSSNKRSMPPSFWSNRKVKKLNLLHNLNGWKNSKMHYLTRKLKSRPRKTKKESRCSPCLSKWLKRRSKTMRTTGCSPWSMLRTKDG